MEISRAWKPLLVGGIVLAAVVYIGAVDPNQPGHYLPCPTRLLLGVDCPGCGGLRAVHSLATGDLAGAADHNLLFVILVPLLVLAWAVWLWRALSGAPPGLSGRLLRVQQPVLVAVIVLTVVFAVVRNFVPYLGSGVS